MGNQDDLAAVLESKQTEVEVAGRKLTITKWSMVKRLKFLKTVEGFGQLARKEGVKADELFIFLSDNAEQVTELVLFTIGPNFNPESQDLETFYDSLSMVELITLFSAIIRHNSAPLASSAPANKKRVARKKKARRSN